MDPKNHQNAGASFFSSAAKSSEWELVPLTNRRSPTTVTQRSSLYTNRKQANMPHLKPQNSFPPGIFDQHFENEKEARADIAAAVIQPTETEKENQQSSLAAAVSTGKVRITEFFAKRTPLGRGGGMGLDNKPMTGPGITAKASTSIPIKAGIATVKQAKMPRNNAKGNHQTTSTMQKSSSPTNSTIQGKAMTSPTSTAANTNNKNQVNSFSSNNNVYTSPSLSNHPHGNGTSVSVNNGIFNSGLDNLSGHPKEDTRDTTMTGNDIGTTAGVGTNAGIIPGKGNESTDKLNPTSGVNQIGHDVQHSDGGRDAHPRGHATDNTTVPDQKSFSGIENGTKTSDTSQGDTDPDPGVQVHGDNTDTVTHGAENHDSGINQGGSNTTGETKSNAPINGTGTQPVVTPQDLASIIPKVFATANTTVVSFHIRPKADVVEFNLEEIFRGMIVAFTAVDSTMWFKSWKACVPEKVWSLQTIPQTDEAMKDFVEDAHTAPIGPYGRFYGRIIITSTVDFPSFRKDKVFSAFLRRTGLFIERSELKCTRTRPIGFFTKKLPHETRIPFFDAVLHKMVPFRHPMQILSAPLYEGPGSTVKCFVYNMIADPRHESDLLEDLKVFQHPDFEFHAWSAYKESKQRTKKVGIINDMNTFAIDHSSILIKGLEMNGLMRLCVKQNTNGNNANTNESEELVDAITLDAANTSDADNEHDNTARDLNQQLQEITCIDFLYRHFVDSEGNPIYVQINGPCNGLIEVIFHNDNWDYARKIEKQFQAIMINFMTPTSIRHCFTNGQQLISRPPDIIHWNPPTLRTDITPANTMNSVDSPPLSKKLRHVNFSYTTKSNYSYRSAALAGTRKVDIPSTTQLLTYAAVVSDNPTTTTHHSSIVSTMSEAEILKKFQKYEEDLAQLQSQVTHLIQIQSQTTTLITQTETAITTLENTTQDIFSSNNTEIRSYINRTTDAKIKSSNDIMEAKIKTNNEDIRKYIHKTTDDKIQSNNDEICEYIHKSSRKQSKKIDKTQEMILLLLAQNNIPFPTNDNDDSDDEDYEPDFMEDPDDKYDSAEEEMDNYDDEEFDDYDDSLPYINPNQESQRAASPSGFVDHRNIIHNDSRTRSQSQSQSQCAAGSQ